MDERASSSIRSAAAGSERGRHLREMLDELGPTFVKFGQLLSTRPDVVPPDIVAELRSLQDDVRPFPFAQVREVIEAELGLTLEQAFLRFDEQPIAAASIGQVHRATLPNGDEVAVKVQRPNAPRQIESDLALLYQAARMIKERVRALDFIDAHALVDEFARSSARSSTTSSRRATRTRSAATSPARSSSSCRRSTGTTPAPGCSRSSTSTASSSPTSTSRRRSLEERRELAYRVTRDVDGDDLPARLLPRRPASGERARARGRPDRPRRLRARRQADRGGHGAADAALHRRRDREHRRAPAPARRARRPLSEGARGGVRDRSCASSSTATSAPASPRSTRSR